MVMCMKIDYVISEIGDRIEVTIFEKETKRIELTREYAEGTNCSFSRQAAEWAKRDHENSLDNGWLTVKPNKPYIGDILDDFCNTYYINEEEINWGGRIIKANREMTKQELEERTLRLVSEL